MLKQSDSGLIVTHTDGEYKLWYQNNKKKKSTMYKEIRHYFKKVKPIEITSVVITVTELLDIKC